MAFSIRQLLFSMAVVAFGMVAIGVNNQIFGKLFDLLTLGILVAMAYRAWLSRGEMRAFSIGFVSWTVIYVLLFKPKLDIGLRELFVSAYNLLVSMTVAPASYGASVTALPWSSFYPNFTTVSHCLLMLLLGVVGGWVTVYFYRKRQHSVHGDTPRI